MSNISWRSVKHKFAVTIYNFVPTFDSAASGYHNFLSILVGEEVIILEECLGWFRGYRHHHPNNIGIFPSSFVHILDCLLINEGICFSVTRNIIFIYSLNLHVPLGIGCFATGHSLTKAASRILFVRIRCYSLQ